MKVQKRRVVLLLHPSDAQVCIELSADIATREGVHFTLGQNRNVPHITLVATHLPDGADDAAWDIVRAVVQTTQCLELPYTETLAVDGWVCAMTERIAEVVALHEALLEPLCELRTEEMVQAMRRDVGEDPLREAYAKKYGHTSVREFYNPHGTLTRTQDVSSAPRIAAEVQWPMPVVRARDIALCESGAHGVCTRVLRTEALIG